MSGPCVTLAYRGCWIHITSIGNYDRVRWQGADGIAHPCASVRAAKQRITMHLRRLGLLDKPYAHRMTVNGSQS